MAEELYRAASPLLTQEADSRRYRLVGVGVAELVSAAQADLPDLLDPARDKRVKIERAIDQVRAKLGDADISKGRALVPKCVGCGKSGCGRVDSGGRGLVKTNIQQSKQNTSHIRT